MTEGTRYRYRVTSSVAEVVYNYGNSLQMVALVNGLLFKITRTELIQDWRRLDGPR